jgi:membrane fusion protein, multidrug efflux system
MRSFFHQSSATRARMIGGLALAPLLLVACGKPAPTEEPVRAVKLVTVTVSGMDTRSEYAGEVRARIESRLGFRVPGKLTRRAVEVGQRVARGQLLAQVDPQDYRLAADAARAQVMAAQTQRDLAAADLKRYRELREQNFISGAELERRETTLKSAQASLEQAQAQLSAQGNQATYTDLVADAPGVVTAVEAESGQVVSAGSTVVRLAHDGPRDVVFSVPEDRMIAFRPGLAVQVRSWSGGGELRASVRERAASADPVTRTFQIKVALPQSEPLALGSTAYVALQAPNGKDVPSVIKLPTSALRQEGGRTAVWVLDGPSMSVRSRPVEIAGADQNQVVIAAGLKPGEEVVVAGVHVLAQGQKVTRYQERIASAGAASPASAAR